MHDPNHSFRDVADDLSQLDRRIPIEDLLTATDSTGMNRRQRREAARRRKKGLVGAE